MMTKELRLESFSAEGLQFPLHGRNGHVSKSFYGGEDMNLSFELDRDPRINYRDVAYGNDVILRRGLNPVFKGEMRAITQGEETLIIGCPGQWIYLEDYNHGDAQRIWCENRYKRWLECTDDMPLVTIVNWTPEKYAMDNSNRLFIAPRKNEVFRIAAPASNGGFCYICDTAEITRISFDYDIDLAWTTNFELRLYSIATGGVSWLEWVPGAGTVATEVLDITLANPGGAAYALVFYVSPSALLTYTGETGESVYAIIKNLRLWGQTTESHSSIHVMEAAIDEVAVSTPIDASHDLALEELPVRDLFTDANGTLLAAHLPDRNEQRGLWTIDAGGFNIQANQANNTVNASRAVINSGLSDCVVACDVQTPAATPYGCGIAFRRVDANNYWAWRFTAVGTILLERTIGGATVTIATITVGPQLSTTYHLMVKLRADEIKCYLGGILRTTTNDTNHQTATYHGLISFARTNMRWDNFEVQQMLPLWPLFYEDGESCYQAVKDAASFGDWEYRALGWGVESGGDRAFLRVANRNSVRYMIPAQFCRQLSSRGETQGKFYTSGWAKYIDDEGITRFTAKYYVHVTNTGLTINTTATGNDLASTVYGVDRDHTFDFGRVDAELAVEYLVQSLKEQGHPKVQTSIEVYGPVKDLHRGGALIEPIEMEMGYLVQIPFFRATEAEGAATTDLRDFDTTLLIVGMELDLETGVAKLIPEGAQEDLSRMIKAARAVVEQDEKRLTSKRSKVVGG